MTEGVDYSSDHPDPTGLYAVGKRFAGRYVGAGYGPKMLTASEVGALNAAGLSVVSLVEGAVLDPLSGQSTGRLHAQLASDHAKLCGAPSGAPLYFAVDFDVTVAQWPLVRAYLTGAASVVGASRVGVYGGYNAMVWAARDKVAAWLFQTYAWSGGRWYSGNHMEQYRNGVSLVGGNVDLCRGMTPYFGQWMRGSGPVTLPQGDEDMLKGISWSVGRGAPKQPGATPTGNEAITYWCGHVTDRLVELQASVDGLIRGDDDASSVDVAALAASIAALTEKVDALASTPLVDAMAVAQAFASRPELAEALGAAVAARLSKIDGSITLSGSLSGGIKATPAP
jgi:hypothetical protein